MYVLDADLSNMTEFFTLSSSVIIKYNDNNKVKNIVSNRLYRYKHNLTWSNVFDEVVDENVELKKTDFVTVSVSSKTGAGVECFEPDINEPICVVQEFDKRLKFATFTINRDAVDEDAVTHKDGNNNKKADAFAIMMGTQTLSACNKDPIKINKDSLNGRFTVQKIQLKK